jgi:hypothetical protein
MDKRVAGASTLIAAMPGLPCSSWVRLACTAAP